MNLLDTLRELGDAINESCPTINLGGCCVYAAAVAKRLEALGIPVDVCVPTYGHAETVDEARNNLRNNGSAGRTAKEWEEAGLYFAHVAVRFQYEGVWWTHDTDALHEGRDGFGKCSWNDDKPRYQALPDGMTPDEALRIASHAKGWNSSFDRRDIPMVRSMVEEALQ